MGDFNFYHILIGRDLFPTQTWAVQICLNVRNLTLK